MQTAVKFEHLAQGSSRLFSFVWFASSNYMQRIHHQFLTKRIGFVHICIDFILQFASIELSPNMVSGWALKLNSKWLNRNISTEFLRVFFVTT